MTDKQREQIRKLRYEGAGYKAIATELDLSLNTVKSYCRRNLLQGAGSVAAINNLVSVGKGLVCKNCGKQLRHTEGKRKRVFCSDSCRKKHWKQKKELEMIEKVEPKAVADGIAVFCAHDKIIETDSLVGNPRNPNKHPTEQIDALARLKHRDKPTKQQLLLVEIRKILDEHPDNDNYGSRRMHTALTQRSVNVSERTVYRAMKAGGYIHKCRKPHGITKATTEIQEKENLIKRNFKANEPMTKLLTDITEIPCDAV